MYAAEIDDAPGNVLRVIVGTPEWAEANLGGTWTEVGNFYDSEPETVRVAASAGFKYDPGVLEAFTFNEWDSSAATTPPYAYNTEGQLTWHQDRMWRNLSPTGTPNVYEPGVASWREYPLGNEYPLWIQPVGAVDAYPRGFTVEHEGGVWTSNVDANVWEPNSTGAESLWESGTEPSAGVPPITVDPVFDWGFYEVQSGDTLWSLSQAWGYTLEVIAQDNGIGDADVIFAGQTLRRRVS